MHGGHLEFSSELWVSQRQIQDWGHDIESSANDSFYEAVRDGPTMHLALLGVTGGP